MPYLSLGRPERPSCLVSSCMPLLYPASASALISLFRPEELPLQGVKSWCSHTVNSAALVQYCSIRQASATVDHVEMAQLTERREM